MARIRLWNDGMKNADYRFHDRTISEFFNASGAGLYIHLYEGTYGQDGMPDKDVSEVQDVVWGENRDRKYSQEVYEMRGVYTMTDSDFDLRQFGLFLTGDTVFVEVHYNDMLNLLGRKIMIGDVIEFPHLRDDAPLKGNKATNKFYVVEDANRATDGYGSSWLSHIWRVKIVPMTGGQEYADILDQTHKDPFGLETGGTLEDILTNIGAEVGMNNEILALAEQDVKARYFETRQFYMVRECGAENEIPWIFAGDGIPPNGAELVGSGDEYPDDAPLGTYFLRTDYSPHTLFRKGESRWIMQEIDYRRGRWSAAHRLFEDFINNDAEIVLQDGSTIKSKQALSKAFKLNTDLL